jgi:hypothetical protein
MQTHGFIVWIGSVEVLKHMRSKPNNTHIPTFRVKSVGWMDETIIPSLPDKIYKRRRFLSRKSGGSVDWGRNFLVFFVVRGLSRSPIFFVLLSKRKCRPHPHRTTKLSWVAHYLLAATWADLCQVGARIISHFCTPISHSMQPSASECKQASNSVEWLYFCWVSGGLFGCKFLFPHCALPRSPKASVWPLQNHEKRCAKCSSVRR